MVPVELVYVALGKDPIYRHVSLLAGATVADALQQSELWNDYPETNGLSLGIFSKTVSLDTVLKSGDRIEIYRPLVSSPKDKRRQRARKK